MRKLVQSVFPVLVVLSVLVSGCAPSPEKIAEQVAVALTATASVYTLTPSPTVTFTPTATVTNTPTSTPTLTPTVEPPIPLTDLLTNLKVVSIDTFDTLNKNDWINSSDSSVENGALVVNNVNNNIANTNDIEGGDGLLFKFKLSSRSIKQSQIFLENSAYGTPEYKHVGLEYNSGNGLNVTVFRTDWMGYPFAGFSIKPETWYEAVIAIDTNAKFLVYVWNPEKPNQNYKFKSIISDKWTDQVWTFGANINGEGQIFFDDFSKITFDEMK